VTALGSAALDVSALCKKMLSAVVMRKGNLQRRKNCWYSYLLDVDWEKDASFATKTNGNLSRCRQYVD